MGGEKVERFPRAARALGALGLTFTLTFAAGRAHATPPAPAPALPPATCASAEDETASRESFVAAKHAYDVADYDRAIALYLASYAKDCKRHGILPILSGAYEKAGDVELALFVLRAYLERSPAAEDRDATAEKIGNLEKRRAAKRAPAEAPPAPPPPRESAPAPREVLEEHRHTKPPWVLVGAGGVALLVSAIVIPVGLASNDGVHATDPNGNPLFEGNEPVIQRCATFGGECRAYVAGEPTNDPRYAVPDRAARERTHAATQAALASRDTTIAGLVIGGAGAFALAVGLVWHYSEPTGTFARRTASALTTLRPLLGPGLVGGGVGATF